MADQKVANRSVAVELPHGEWLTDLSAMPQESWRKKTGTAVRAHQGRQTEARSVER